MTISGAIAAALIAGLLMGLLFFVTEGLTVENREKKRLEQETKEK